MRKLLTAPLLALAVLLAGCGDSGTGPELSHVGTFNLQTVNGESLPFTVGTFDGVTYTLLSGRVTLNDDNTASDSYRYRAESGTSSLEETETDAGTYTRANNAITVQWNSGASETFSYSGNSLTLSESGFVAVFRK